MPSSFSIDKYCLIAHPLTKRMAEDQSQEHSTIWPCDSFIGRWISKSQQSPFLALQCGNWGERVGSPFFKDAKLAPTGMRVPAEENFKTIGETEAHTRREEKLSSKRERDLKITSVSSIWSYLIAISFLFLYLVVNQ